MSAFQRVWETIDAERNKTELSDQMANCGFFGGWGVNSSLKSAYFRDEHKCWLCLLEASDHSWTHRLLFRLIKCTHTHTTRRGSSLPLIPSVWCTSLHFTSCLSSFTQQTLKYTHSYFIYHPTRLAEGMPPMWHMPTAQSLEDSLNSLHEPTLVQICWQCLHIQIREWVCEQLRGTGGSEGVLEENSDQ